MRYTRGGRAIARHGDMQTSFAIQPDDPLLTHGILTEAALREALERQHRLGGRLGTHLLDLGVISRFTLINLLNRRVGLPLLRVADEITVRTNAVAAFPRQHALRYQVMPIASLPEKFVLGALDLPTPQVRRELAAIVGKPVQFILLPEPLFHQLRRDHLHVPTDFFATHIDPSKIAERPFQEGHQQRLPRDLIVFEVAGITLAFVRRKKGSTAVRLGDMLVEDGILTQAELEKALARHPEMHLGEALVEENLVDTRMLSRYLSRHYGCATVDPYLAFKIAPDILKLIHPGTARKFLVVPLAIYENNLLLLTAEPENQTLLQIARKESGHEVRPVVSPRVNVRWLVERVYAPKGR